MMESNIIQQVWIHFCLLFTFNVKSCVRLQVWKSSFPQTVFGGLSPHEAGSASPLADLCSSQGTKSIRKPLALTPEFDPSMVLSPYQALSSHPQWELS